MRGREEGSSIPGAPVRVSPESPKVTGGAPNSPPGKEQWSAGGRVWASEGGLPVESEASLLTKLPDDLVLEHKGLSGVPHEPGGAGAGGGVGASDPQPWRAREHAAHFYTLS